MLQVVRLYKMDVAIYRVYIVAGKLPVDAAQHLRAGKEIVRIQQPYHIARGYAQALVHRIVNAMVPFRDPLQPAAVLWFQFLDDGHGIILGIAVHYDMFPVLVILRQHAAHGVAQRSSAVV